MTEREQARNVARRLAMIRYCHEVSVALPRKNAKRLRPVKVRPAERIPLKLTHYLNRGRGRAAQSGVE